MPRRDLAADLGGVGQRDQDLGLARAEPERGDVRGRDAKLVVVLDQLVEEVLLRIGGALGGLAGDESLVARLARSHLHLVPEGDELAGERRVDLGGLARCARIGRGSRG